LSRVVGDFGEPTMQTVAKLVRRILTLRTTVASDHDPGRGHPGKTSEPYELPAHAHQPRRVVA
jgi:hypothetical protein